MSSATFKLDTKSAARVALSACVIAILMSVVLAYAFWKSYSSALASPPGTLAAETGWSSLEPNNKNDLWSSFFRRKSIGQGGRLSESYRLAGTYFEFGASHDTRKAILDELSSGRQHIVSEGQSLSDLLVLSIATDHILVRTPSGAEEELWLSFNSSDGAGGDVAVSPDGPAGTNTVTGEADGFGGKRVGENRWVFERDKLMGYYSELMSEPERLVKIFDSFKPMYTEDGKIDGYEIEVFGEQPFFASTGLEPGDRIRAVNSIDMTNRRRAEYLIKEFVAERVNVIVMDIERGGKPEKFIYQIR